MRVIGVFLLGFGIVLLVFSGIGFSCVQDFSQAIRVLVFTVLIPVPTIIGGIAIIRRIEDCQPGDVNDIEPGLDSNPANPVRGVMARMQLFELNHLNWLGWFLLLVTLGFALAEAAVAAFLVGEGGWGDNITPRVFAPPAVFLTIGFFVGLRWLLGKVGVSIYR